MEIPDQLVPAVIGQTLGHYRILEKIGAGGMGEVYRAHDETLDRDVALKVLPAGSFRDPAARARLLREARTASQLNHPNICTIHEVGEGQGQAYIAMELIEGQPLSARLRAGALPAELVLRYGSQIADALSHAHERQIVHRDLKSANVVVTLEGRVKVLDFGLAKRLSEGELDEATRSQASLTAPGALVGTLAYMAPEQLCGRAADARSDVWALGVALYEMATGGRPFQGQTGFELSSAILNQAPRPLPSQVPTELKAVIERCLDKEPGRRYQRAREVQAALEAIQTGATAPWTALRFHMVQRRWRALALAGVVLLAVLAGLNFERIRTRFWSGAPRIEALAVLPLENLSGNSEQDYLAEGVHEALITDLAKLSGFRRVIARSSVMRYRKSEKPLTQIARELRVDALITGSVLRSGDRVQVTAHLVNATTEEQIWGDRYEREVRDVLSLENEIVAAITRGIKLNLTAQEQQQLTKARAVNPEAYEIYLKGRFHVAKFTPEGFERGLAYLRQAVEKDPMNPLAYSQLAVAYSMVGHDIIPDAFIQAKAAARKALELDSNSAEAYEVLAEIKLYSDWDDWQGAADSFRRALALNPNLAMGHRNYSWYLNVMGRSEEGIAEMKRAVEIDPMNPLFHEDLGWQYWDLRQTEKAIEEARKALAVDPNFPYALLLLALAHGEGGMYTEAIAAGQKLAQVEPDLRWGLAMSYARAGRKDQALRVVDEIKKQPSPWGDWGLAEVYAVLGDRQEALRWLEQGFQDRFSLMPWLRLKDAGLERPFEPFRDDPRYQDLLRRMNLPP